MRGPGGVGGWAGPRARTVVGLDGAEAPVDSCLDDGSDGAASATLAFAGRLEADGLRVVELRAAR